MQKGPAAQPTSPCSDRAITLLSTYLTPPNTSHSSWLQANTVATTACGPAPQRLARQHDLHILAVGKQHGEFVRNRVIGQQNPPFNHEYDGIAWLQLCRSMSVAASFHTVCLGILMLQQDVVAPSLYIIHAPNRPHGQMIVQKLNLVYNKPSQVTILLSQFFSDSLLLSLLNALALELYKVAFKSPRNINMQLVKSTILSQQNTIKCHCFSS